MIYDIAVIGTGSVGSFAGFYGAKLGQKICMIDKFAPIHTFGSYHGDTRIFRIAYGEGSKYIPLLKQAYELWKDFEKQTKLRFFEDHGLLNAGIRENEFMQNILESAREFKLDLKELNAEEIYENYGIVVPKDYCGLLEPNTGFTYSDLSVKTAINEAIKLGAKGIWADLKYISKKDGLYELGFENEKIFAKNLLISAGSFVKEVIEAFEFDLPAIPISAKRKVVHWYESNNNYKMNRNLASFILEFEEDHFYGFCDFGEGVKIGRDQSGQFINSREERKDFGAFTEDMSEINDHIKKFFPKLGNFIKGSVCSYPMSPDNDFIIDFLEENIFYIGGLSHGFKFAPLLGELGIKALQNKKLDAELYGYFSLSRFK